MKKLFLLTFVFLSLCINGISQNIIKSYISSESVEFIATYNYEQHSIIGHNSPEHFEKSLVSVYLNADGSGVIYYDKDNYRYTFYIFGLHILDDNKGYEFILDNGEMFLLDQFRTCIFYLSENNAIILSYKGL